MRIIIASCCLRDLRGGAPWACYDAAIAPARVSRARASVARSPTRCAVVQPLAATAPTAVPAALE